MRSLVVSVLALLVAAPAASATTVTSNPGFTLFVIAGAGETNQIVISHSGGVATITDPEGVQAMGGSGCVPDNPNQLSCTSAGYSSVEVAAGDGDDSVRLSLALSGQGMLKLAGEAGNDVIDASGVSGPSLGIGTRQIAGFAGNDTLIGTPGSDLLDGQMVAPCIPGPGCLGGPPPPGTPDNPADAGDDILMAGEGNDTTHPGRGADTADGGGGDDTMHTVLSLFVGAPGSDDSAFDNIICGTGNDNADLGVGDQVDSDCELIGQLVTCPGGATCEVAPSVTAPAGGGAASSLAAASKKGRGKKGKGKRKVRVLGVGQKSKISAGTTQGVTIRMRVKEVNKALGKRASITATFLAAITRTKKGKVIGKIKRKRRFKLNR
jgi:Ca2+-binding RTX toxin-like protein